MASHDKMAIPSESDSGCVFALLLTVGATTFGHTLPRQVRLDQAASGFASAVYEDTSSILVLIGRADMIRQDSEARESDKVCCIGDTASKILLLKVAVLSTSNAQIQGTDAQTGGANAAPADFHAQTSKAGKGPKTPEGALRARHCILSRLGPFPALTTSARRSAGIWDQAGKLATAQKAWGSWHLPCCGA